MVIKQIVVHQLLDDPEQEGIVPVPADQSLQTSGSLDAMLNHLLETYNKKANKHYGVFDDDGQGFPFSLTEYLNNRQNFMALSSALLQKVCTVFNEAGLRGSSYLLCADYMEGMTRYFLFCLLTDHVSVTVTHDLSITDCAYLDLTSMPMACRINLTIWQQGSDTDRYLSYSVPGGKHRLQQVVPEIISGSESGGSREEADKLVDVVTDYCQKTSSEDDRIVVKQQVYDYCCQQLKDGEDVSLAGITHQLSESGQDDFARFVNTQDYDMTVPMSPDRRTLIRLVRYSGRGKGISLSFDAGLLGSQVCYDPDTDKLVIHGVPDNLKKQLNQK
ncbi:Nucleoid-associated protein YejK [invertebrate metagenome]|uniref:Nucleoid-associated protein YejK n=1 Tax=invertebrate metagenome TaxID=1711999 RepID=A0A2H9T6W0_9ZZZZ